MPRIQTPDDRLAPVWGRSLVLAVFLSAAIMVASCSAQSSELPTSASRADSLVDSVIERGAPGVVVLVGQNGDVAYERAAGSANITHHAPMRSDTKVRIGSITKQFTAVAVMKLQQEGVLRVADPLSRFIPEHVRSHDITLHHLLTHTSGVPNHTRKSGFWRRAVLPVQRDSLIASIVRDTLEFTPGTRCAYSSAGYELLGAVVGAASGSSWEDYLREAVLRPMGLEDTDLHDWYTVYENLADGYQVADGDVFHADERNSSHFPASGGLYSTAPDLFRWTTALFGGEILGSISLDAMTSPAHLADGSIAQAGPFGAGYGMGIRNVDARVEYSHGGGFNGYEAWVAHYPDEALTVVVLMNCNPYPDGTGTQDIGLKLARLFWE